MPWWQLSIRCSADELEATEARLLSLGAVSITLGDAFDQPIYEPLPGNTPVWQHSIMTAMFAAEHSFESIYDSLVKALPNHQMLTLEHAILEDQDWERVHLEHFHPIRCAPNLWVVPGWLEPPDPLAVNIRLDPGLAFGTGSHPTTALCLAWMAAHDFNRQSVIDYGCGSGILSIAAAKLGARRVLGVDIDPQAIDASIENARRNRIDETRLQSMLVSDLPDAPVDLLVANILSGPLVELAPRFAALVKPGGKILLSGILNTQVDDIRCAYQSSFDLDPVGSREDWVRISGTRKNA